MEISWYWDVFKTMVVQRVGTCTARYGASECDALPAVARQVGSCGCPAEAQSCGLPGSVEQQCRACGATEKLFVKVCVEYDSLPVDSAVHSCR